MPKCKSCGYDKGFNIVCDRCNFCNYKYHLGCRECSHYILQMCKATNIDDRDKDSIGNIGNLRIGGY